MHYEKDMQMYVHKLVKPKFLRSLWCMSLIYWCFDGLHWL